MSMNNKYLQRCTFITSLTLHRFKRYKVAHGTIKLANFHIYIKCTKLSKFASEHVIKNI